MTALISFHVTSAHWANMISGGGSRRLIPGDEPLAILTGSRRHTDQDSTTGGAL